MEAFAEITVPLSLNGSSKQQHNLKVEGSRPCDARSPLQSPGPEQTIVKVNQDRGSVEWPFAGSPADALFGVFDGHGKVLPDSPPLSPRLLRAYPRSAPRTYYMPLLLKSGDASSEFVMGHLHSCLGTLHPPLPPLRLGRHL